MYLIKLYKANKWWFAVIICFIVVQLILDIKQGIAISPVYHYGMYSKKVLPQAQYNVTEIWVNNKLLQTKDFTPYQWDKISLAADLFYKQKDWNSFVWNNDVKRLMHCTDSAKYINHINSRQFYFWYKIYLSNLLHEDVTEVEIKTATYFFDKSQLIKKYN